ncbi:MAG TPA: tetratricopeptide repeat protein [Ktedonobacterales bacterium]|nr:tetratricopeptide repeat protein [Ktedonobacterales bacterium]
MPRETHKARKPSSHKASQPAAAAAPINAAAQQAAQALLHQIPDLSQHLRQAGDRAAAAQALAAVEEQPADIVLAFAGALGTKRTKEAADVALAMAELSQHREARKEARRSLVRLRSMGIAPVFSLPALQSIAQPVQRVFFQGYVSQTRDQGEVQLALAWYENQAAGAVRGVVFSLEFWRAGVKDFVMTDSITPKRFERDYARQYRTAEQAPTLPVTLAQARQLVQEALSINEWRKTPLPNEYKRHYITIRDLLLNAQISEEEELAAAEGDRLWIARDLEPEEAVADFLGAWSFGDYGLVYDLLADEHAARRAPARDEFVQQRRQWADEAEPAGLRLLLVRERASDQQSLWVPTGVHAGGRKEIEAFWSLQLKDSPLGGQMEELPMGTIISRDSNRHWYWTSYTLVRQEDVWRMSRQRDDGRQAQGLPIEELQKRVKDSTEKANQLAQTQPKTPEETQDTFRELIGTVVTSLHDSDALIARLPLDRSVYDQATLDARSIAQYERAAAYYTKMLDRFGDRARLLAQVGVMQYLTGEREGQEGNQAGARIWWDRATTSLEESLALEPTPDTYQALGELRARDGKIEAAAQLMRQALDLDPSRAEVWSELGTLQLSQNEARTALESYQKAVELNSNLPGIHFRIGRAYRALGDNESARLAYEEAIRRNPNDTESYNNLAALLQEQQPERAIEMLERAITLAPDAALYHANLAALSVRTGAIKRGKAELERAEQLDPAHPVVRQVRAMVKGLKV